MEYIEANIDERILRAITEMGFSEMTPIQEQAIPVFLTGQDIIGQAQTGTGKTAAFGIPTLQKIDPDNKALQAIILCPTRELAMQAAEELRKFAKYMHGIKVLPIYGGQDIVKQIKNLKSGVQIVVGTPGRVMDHMRRKTMRMDQVHTIILDEADEMLNMGFREDIETILKDIPEDRQTALFSATMPKPILEITKEYQKDAAFIKITAKEVTIDTIKQLYYMVRHHDKNEVLSRLIDYYDPEKALIFCNTKRMVDELAKEMKRRGYLAEGLHGDLTQAQRDTVMGLFKEGRANFLIATDVAARGIDVKGVDAVFNYDVPEDIEYYVHRIGRTGRAGQSGIAFTFVCGREIYKLRDIERICHTHIDEAKVPSAERVTSHKAAKILKANQEVIDSQDLTQMIQFISRASAKYGYTMEQYAAAFLKQQMGDDLEELEPDDFLDKLRKRTYGDRKRHGGHSTKTERRGEYRGERRGERRNERGGRSERSNSYNKGRNDRGNHHSGNDSRKRNAKGNRNKKG